MSKLLRHAFLKFYRNMVTSSIHGNLPSKHKGFIIVAPHKTGADPVVLESALGLDIYFIVDAQFFVRKFQNYFFSHFVGGLPGSVKYPFLSVRGVREAIRKLKKGEVVGIFPEGTMVRNPYIIGEFKHGAAYLSMKTGKPVIPVFLRNIIPGPLPPDPQQYDLGFEGFCSVVFNVGNKVDIFIGNPIYPDILDINKKNIINFTNKIREHFFNLIPSFY